MSATTSTPIAEPCPCYRCAATAPPDRATSNLHGKLRPCAKCGRAKTEYVDHGSWGEYRCWWCTEREAVSRVLPEVPR